MPFKGSIAEKVWKHNWYLANRERELTRQKQRRREQHPDVEIVEHHIKYKEIHGEDVTVFLPKSDHTVLHQRLRKEGKCNIPSDELSKIATAAHYRTNKRLAATRSRYKNRILFQETVTSNIRLIEGIEYYSASGNIIVCSFFQGNNGYKIEYLEE